MNKENIKKAWQNFLDALIEDDFDWSDYFNEDTQECFRDGLAIINRIFKKEGVY